MINTWLTVRGLLTRGTSNSVMENKAMDCLKLKYIFEYQKDKKKRQDNLLQFFCVTTWERLEILFVEGGVRSREEVDDVIDIVECGKNVLKTDRATKT